MRRQQLIRMLLVAGLLPLIVPVAAEAQSRGRTDGPPGSHIGAGGYEAAGFYRYSAEMQFGAALSERPALSGRDDGPPLSFGAAFSFWGDDWVRLDLSAHHLFHNSQTFFLVGPRFQTGFWPVSASAGVKGGLAIVPDFGIRFAISPQVGAEMLIGDRLVLGLGYALDIPVDTRDSTVVLSHRPHMNMGFRF